MKKEIKEKIIERKYPNDFINTIICGDCLEVMKEIPEKSVDLVITSPPYDNLRYYQGYNFNFEGIVKELFRIAKIGGVVVWVVGDATINGSETGTSFKQALYFKEIGFNIHDTMIYQKAGFSNPSYNRYHQTFEYMFVFSKGMPKTINLIKDRENIEARDGDSGTKRLYDGTLLRRNKVGYLKYGRRTNIWKYYTGRGHSASDKIAYKHPAIFSEKLAQDHIISWSNKNDLVLDPFNGSGTTTKMAKILGRNFIGIEISPDYCEIAKQRLRQNILL